MNRQYKSAARRGIEWTDYTWNPTAGCHHGCQWRMPDGSIASCYAGTIATRIAASAYSEGFAHHYWRPATLREPGRLEESAKIFVGSMADLFGHWVPEEQIRAVFDVIAKNGHHTFQTLSKYPVRIPIFNPYPANAWIGVSVPAGHLMSHRGAQQALWAYLRQMSRIEAQVRFLSIEPLWFDMAAVLTEWLEKFNTLPFEWVIIGAASNGRSIYQPRREWVEDLLAVVDEAQIPVFFKGNLEWPSWREEFPDGTFGVAHEGQRAMSTGQEISAADLFQLRRSKA